MNVDDARRAIVAFLDQFIERGAASDVIAVRDRLRDSPDSDSEVARYLPPNEVDAEGVFEAMRRLLETEPAVNEPSQPDLAELLSWTARDAEGQTADPAQWHDWLRGLAALRDRPEGP